MKMFVIYPIAVDASFTPSSYSTLTNAITKSSFSFESHPHVVTVFRGTPPSRIRAADDFMLVYKARIFMVLNKLLKKRPSILHKQVRKLLNNSSFKLKSVLSTAKMYNFVRVFLRVLFSSINFINFCL